MANDGINDGVTKGYVGTTILASVSAIAPSVVIFADPGTVVANATRYMRVGSIASTVIERTYKIPAACTVKSLQVSVLTAPGGSVSDTYTLRKNGSDSAMTVTITGAAVSAIDSTHTVSLAAGDTISVSVASQLLSIAADIVAVVQLG